MASETRSSTAKSKRPEWLLPLLVFGGVAGSVSVTGSLLMFVLSLLGGSGTAPPPPEPAIEYSKAFRQRAVKENGEPDRDRVTAEVADADAKWLAGLQKVKEETCQYPRWPEDRGDNRVGAPSVPTVSASYA